MKVVSKRVLTMVVACMMACQMFATPVFAATNYFSKTTVKLNAISGVTSTESKVTSPVEVILIRFTLKVQM